MKQRIFFLTKVSVLALLINFGNQSELQSQESNFEWPEGKKAAISLSFDDARESHPLIGKDLFRRLNAKVTYYVVPSGMEPYLDEWKEIVADGHEIGNHTVYHPCTGNFPWARNRALENYTLSSMKNELLSANQQIMEMLDVAPISFAYTCGNTFVGRGRDTKSYVPLIAELFENGRGWLNEASNDPEFADLSLLQGIEMDGKDFEDIKPLVDAAINSGTWLLLAGHEIGPDGFQTTRVNMLEDLVGYVESRKDEIWLATVGDVASHLISQREQQAQDFKSAMTFCATFDNGYEADYSKGNSSLMSAPGYGKLDFKIEGVVTPEIGILSQQGKIGDALEFKRKSKSVIFYEAKDNIDYHTSDWDGTVSFWLSLSPGSDLAPGFTDPIQITDQSYDDAAIWVDFSDKNPRDFRMGIFGDVNIWNPDKLKPDNNPAFIDRLVLAEENSFQRGSWTHVAISFSNLNSAAGHASLYINGKKQGSKKITEPLTWEEDKSKIFLGLNFVGLIDEVSIFNRAFDDSEINSLYQLPDGLRSILAENP